MYHLYCTYSSCCCCCCCSCSCSYFCSCFCCRPCCFCSPCHLSDALSSLPLGSAHHPIEKNTPSRRPKRLARQPPSPLMFPPAKCLLHHCWSVRQLGDQRMSWVSPKNEGFTVYRNVCCTCSSGPPTIGQFKTCC